MTDKVQKIREEVERLREKIMGIRTDFAAGQKSVLTELLVFIDSFQEEPVKDKFAFKAIPRLLDMIEPSDRAKAYIAKLADTLEVEGYSTDAKIVMESLKIMNGEKVPIATMDEEPVSIWHDASEEPNGDNSIVIAYDNGCTVEPSLKDFKSYSEWGTIKKSYRVKQWAYVNDVLNLTNKEEPVSEELQEASEKCIEELIPEAELNSASPFALEYVVKLLHETFRAGAKWQKEKEYTCYEEAFEDGAKWKVENLWKPADGDDLPEYDREVVVFTQNFPNDAGIMSVAIGHRPNPDGWDGKSLTTGEVEHYIPKTYDKGGWNIPNVKWWLDCLLPNMDED